MADAALRPAAEALSKKRSPQNRPNRRPKQRGRQRSGPARREPDLFDEVADALRDPSPRALLFYVSGDTSRPQGTAALFAAMGLPAGGGTAYLESEVGGATPLATLDAAPLRAETFDETGLDEPLLARLRPIADGAVCWMVGQANELFGPRRLEKDVLARFGVTSSVSQRAAVTQARLSTGENTILSRLPGLLGVGNTHSERTVGRVSTAMPLDLDRRWTFDDLQSLPDELARRCEIVDGSLVVSPSPSTLHQRVVLRIGAALVAAVPVGWDVVAAIDVDLAPTYRATDVTVIVDRAVLLDRIAPTSPGDVVIAIEIESPSSVTTDRITKPAEYAAGGIPHYWRIELDPLQLHVYRLAGDVYELSGSWGATETARITDPFEVEIDVSALAPGSPNR